MKLKLVILTASSALFSSIAFADADLDPAFYVGGEIHANKFSSVKTFQDTDGEVIRRKDSQSLLKKAGMSGAAIFGSRLNDYIGLEAGYSAMHGPKYKLGNHTKTSERVEQMLLAGPGVSLNYKIKTKNHNIHFDVLGFAPMTPEIDLIGSVGVGRLSTKVKETMFLTHPELNRIYVKNIKSSKTRLRAGVGAAYKFSEGLSVRLMVRHQKGNKLVKNVTQAGLGLFYNF